jgi:hypothetical protein
VSEPTTAASTATSAASKRASAAADKAIPVVVETVEVVTELPAKVVLNQKLIVIASVLGGAALGAGALWGVNKWRNRNKVVVEVPDSPNQDVKSDGFDH